MSVVCIPEIGHAVPAVAPPIRRVLCATDFSPLANSAIAYANTLLPQGGELLLVHVMDDYASKDERYAARRQLESLAKGDGKANVTIEVMTYDDPAEGHRRRGTFRRRRHLHRLPRTLVAHESDARLRLAGHSARHEAPGADGACAALMQRGELDGCSTLR
jgi:hypothetical protein